MSHSQVEEATTGKPVAFPVYESPMQETRITVTRGRTSRCSPLENPPSRKATPAKAKIFAAR